MVLLFQVTLLKYIGDGPMWTYITESQIPACEKYWWSGLIYVQNYVNPDELVGACIKMIMQYSRWCS